MTSLKDRIENNVYIVLVAVAMSSGAIVFSVTQYFHNVADTTVNARHQLAIESIEEKHKRILSNNDANIGSLKADQDEFEKRIGQLNRDLSNARIKDNFLSLHARVITIGNSFGRKIYTGDLSDLREWEFESTAQEYRKLVAKFSDEYLDRINSTDNVDKDDFVSVHYSRIAPPIVAFSDGTKWPVVSIDF